MSRKKKTPEAVPAEILAEGSGPVGAPADVTDEAEVGMPVVVAEAEAKPAKRKRGRKAEVVEAAADEAESADPDADAESAEPDVADADAEEIGAAVDARADDVADELAASAGEGGAGAAESIEAAESEDVESIELAEGDAAGGDAADGDAVAHVEGEPGEALAEGPVLPAAMDAVQLRQLVEALIFATDKPITLQRLRQLSRISDVKRIEQALAELAEQYKDRGIALHQVSGGYQFRTNTAFSPWVQQLIAGRPVRLSRAQLETLAIIAYRQPITRPEIDEIRGVDSSATLRLLLDRALVRVLGKREEVGRPILYGTTKEFLDFFSLGDLRELPTLREYSELTAESRQVMSDRLGVPLGEEPGSIGEMGVGLGDIDVGINRDPTVGPGGAADPADLAGSFPAASAAAAADASDAAIDAAFERDDTGTDDDATADDEADDPEPDEALSPSEGDEAWLASAEEPLVDVTTADHAAYVSSDDDEELASAANTDELEDSLSARAARRLRELDDRDPVSREPGDLDTSEPSDVGTSEPSERDLIARDAKLDFDEPAANPDPIDHRLEPSARAHDHGLEPSARAHDPIETAAELDPVTFDREPGNPAHEPIDEPNE